MPPKKRNKPGPKPGPKPGRGPGRPRLNASRASAGLVSIRLTAELREAVEKIANADSTTLTHVIVTVLQRHLVDVDVLTRIESLETRLRAVEKRPQQLLFQYNNAQAEAIWGDTPLAAASKKAVAAPAAVSVAAAPATPLLVKRPVGRPPKIRIQLTPPSPPAAPKSEGNQAEASQSDAESDPDAEPHEGAGSNGSGEDVDRPWADAQA